MNGFITDKRLERILHWPISFPQTEVRRGIAISISKLSIGLHQRFELRSLTITLVSVLTPGVIPVYLNTALGLCSVGLYQNAMLTGPLAYASITDQTSTANPFSPCIVETPGTYDVIVSNNTNNVDLAITVTGAAKFYY